MMGLILRTAAMCLLLAGSAQAADLASIDADAMSWDLERIRKSIDAYESLPSDDADVLWRLIRAYYNYYDEATERDRSKQEWAADQGYAMAETALAKFPHKAEVVYYWATIGAAYAEVHRVKAPFLIGDLIKALEEARRLVPAIEGGGPDRRLAFLYALPWPLGEWGGKEKALWHMLEAVRFQPERASNRLALAKCFADLKRYDEGWPHVQFMRAGNWTASEHWKKIFLRRTEEVAAEYPQNRK